MDAGEIEQFFYQVSALCLLSCRAQFLRSWRSGKQRKGDIRCDFLGGMSNCDCASGADPRTLSLPKPTSKKWVVFPQIPWGQSNQLRFGILCRNTPQGKLTRPGIPCSLAPTKTLCRSDPASFNSPGGEHSLIFSCFADCSGFTSKFGPQVLRCAIVKRVPTVVVGTSWPIDQLNGGYRPEWMRYREQIIRQNIVKKSHYTSTLPPLTFSSAKKHCRIKGTKPVDVIDDLCPSSNQLDYKVSYSRISL